MQLHKDHIDIAAASIVDLLIDPNTGAAIDAAIGLDDPSLKALLGKLVEIVSGTVTQFTNSRSNPHEDAVAVLDAVFSFRSVRFPPRPGRPLL